jgi:transposase-like protein
MGRIKKTHSGVFKATVALELIREQETIAAICSHYGIHPTQAGRWKEQAQKGLAAIFSGTHTNHLKEKDDLIEQLYTQIGKRDIELEWVKKKMGTIA